MVRFEAALLAWLASSLVACSPPSKRAETALSTSELAGECQKGKADFCEWLGNNEAASGHREAAESAYRRACASGQNAACAHLFQGASAPGAPASRALVLDFLCGLGAVEACEILVGEAQKDPSAQTRSRAVLWLKAACDRGNDTASCARLAMVYDAASFAGVRVLADRDPASAVDLYDRACSSAFDRHDWDPQRSHATPELRAAASELEAASCEKLGDHRAAGDGVPASPFEAVDAYRHGSSRGLSSTACAQKRSLLKQDPRVMAHDDQQASEERQLFAQEQADHARELAEEEARREQQAEEERAAKRQAAEAAAANNAAAWGAVAAGLGAAQQNLAARSTYKPISPSSPASVNARKASGAGATPQATGANSAATPRGTTRSYRGRTVAAADASGAQPSAAKQRLADAAKKQPADAAKQQAEAQRKGNLAACLATDVNCEYGTSNRCSPSVPYTDRFGGRHQISAANMAAKMCDVNIMGWNQQCYAPKIKSILHLADVPALVSRMEDVSRRVRALPGDVRAGMPTCSMNIERVRQLGFWCSNQRSDCLSSTDAAFADLECARQLDEFLYGAENQARRNKLKSDHDAQCHSQFGF